MKALPNAPEESRPDHDTIETVIKSKGSIIARVNEQQRAMLYVHEEGTRAIHLEV